MKSLAVIGVLLVAAVTSVVLLWPMPEGAEPIAYGRDVCAQCRMHLARPGFAGELRGADGTLRKFDDVGCLLQALLASHRETPEAWVEDHDGGGLIPLLTAHLARAESVETPMGYGIVAFREETAARAFADANHGAVVPLEDLLREPVRWAKLPGGRGDEASP